MKYSNIESLHFKLYKLGFGKYTEYLSYIYWPHLYNKPNPTPPCGLLNKINVAHVLIHRDYTICL